MPVHDWTRVNAGTFHDFHSAWIIHIKESLNGGLLPEGYYAQSEQHAGRTIADVLTLPVGESDLLPRSQSGPMALLDAPPKVARKVSANPDAAYRTSRRTVAIRHASNHRIVALLEILSPANKDRSSSVLDFVRKAVSALRQQIHLLVIDLFAPGRHDPDGIHAAIWEDFACDGEEALPRERPLLLASYVAGPLPEAYLEPIAIGDDLPDMPLFLDVDWYVNVPLESAYQAAYRGIPKYWREVLER